MDKRVFSALAACCLLAAPVRAAEDALSVPYEALRHTVSEAAAGLAAAYRPGAVSSIIAAADFRQERCGKPAGPFANVRMLASERIAFIDWTPPGADPMRPLMIELERESGLELEYVAGKTGLVHYTDGAFPPHPDRPDELRTETNHRVLWTVRDAATGQPLASRPDARLYKVRLPHEAFLLSAVQRCDQDMEGYETFVELELIFMRRPWVGPVYRVRLPK